MGLLFLWLTLLFELAEFFIGIDPEGPNSTMIFRYLCSALFTVLIFGPLAHANGITDSLCEALLKRANRVVFVKSQRQLDEKTVKIFAATTADDRARAIERLKKQGAQNLPEFVQAASITGTDEIEAFLDQFEINPENLENLKTTKQEIKLQRIGRWGLVMSTAFAAAGVIALSSNQHLGLYSFLIIVGRGWLRNQVEGIVGAPEQVAAGREKEFTFLSELYGVLENPSVFSPETKIFLQRSFGPNEVAALFTIDPETKKPVLDIFHWVTKAAPTSVASSSN